MRTVAKEWRFFPWIIVHSGEDGRYVNSPEKSGGGAFKNEWGARVDSDFEEGRMLIFLSG